MKKQINIEGMTCKNCARHVEEALKRVNGTRNIVVNLREKNAVLEAAPSVTNDNLKEAVEDTGYEVVDIIDLTEGCR